MTGEEWRPVVGYEGSYEVANLGRVQSLTRDYGREYARKMRARQSLESESA